MKMRVGYFRVSSDEQREKQTIEGQRSEVVKICEAHGAKLDKIYADDGVSGTIPLGKRPFGATLMRDAEAGLMEEVLGWKFDRLGRNLRDFLNLQHRLEELGVQVESITQPIPKGPAGRMMLQMLGTFAELDRANIVENTTRGMTSKAESGGWTGGHIPFGFAVEGKGHTAMLIEHPVNGKLLRHLFEMADEGKSCQEITNYLIRQGVPTARQNPGSIWRPNSVLSILRNDIYTGTRPFRKRQWIKTEDNAGN